MTIRAAVGLWLVACGCGTVFGSGEATLTGSVVAIHTNAPDAPYPGEIGVAGTAVGRVRAYIFDSLPITVVRGQAGAREQGTFATFVIGDSVLMWYDKDGWILDSDPPVYPVTRIEIYR